MPKEGHAAGRRSVKSGCESVYSRNLIAAAMVAVSAQATVGPGHGGRDTHARARRFYLRTHDASAVIVPVIVRLVTGASKGFFKILFQHAFVKLLREFVISFVPLLLSC